MGEISKILPFPRALYNRCEADGVVLVLLSMTGGSDQGYYDVSLTYKKKGTVGKDNALEGDITVWAESVYEYDGAGDGYDYGDDIEYNIPKKTASLSSWCMERTETNSDISSFDILENDDDGDDDEEENKFTSSDVFDLVFWALKNNKDFNLTGVEKTVGNKIIISVNDGSKWILDHESISPVGNNSDDTGETN